MTTSQQSLVSEAELRAAAVKELGIEDLGATAQEEIMAMVRETLLEYVNIAVMRALGVNGVSVLADVETPDAMDMKLAELLPNIGEIVKGAIEEGLKNHRAAVDTVRQKYGAPVAPK